MALADLVVTVPANPDPPYTGIGRVAAGPGTLAVAVADFNRDGNLDLASADGGPSSTAD